MGMAFAQAQQSDRLSQDVTSRPSPGGVARAFPAIPALPRLGASFAEYREQFPLQRTATVIGGWVLRAYDTEAGSLTVLFDRGVSVALHLPYDWLALGWAELQALLAQLAPAAVAKPRLLIGDTGWLLATDACDRFGLRVLIQIVEAG